MRSTDDRTTAARIRDAAIECFAAEGVAGTSIRTIAAASGVSPGLVIHHFGSKDELRTACDDYVAALIRELKSEAIAAGAGIDPVAALRDRPAARRSPGTWRVPWSTDRRRWPTWSTNS